MAGEGTPPRKGRGQHGGGRVPIDSKTRARVIELARSIDPKTGKPMARNAIAREAGISGSTVAGICAKAVPPILFDRTATKAAVEAHTLDLKAQRQELAQTSIDSARALYRKLTAPHEVIHWDKDGFMHRGEIDTPTSGDIKNYAVAIGILLDKHLVLVKHDSDDRDLPAVDAWLAHVLGDAA